MRIEGPVRGDPQDKLRELVLLYSQRDKVLTTAEEDSIVNTAVSEYGFTVGAARAIVIATAAGAGIEVEGDYEDAAKAMLVALGGTRKSITEADFALIAQYYLGKSKLPQDGVCQSSCPLNLFHAASRSCPAMGAPPPASWWSASAPPRPCRSSLGRSGLSQTDPTGSQFRVLPDHRAGCLARAA